MALYTAAQALDQVALAQTAIDTASTETIVAKYQYIFTNIESKAKKAGTSIVAHLKKPQYTQLAPVLIANGYTVEAWPGSVTSATESKAITISWGSSPTIPSDTGPITAIHPTAIGGVKDVTFESIFYVEGGYGPYTFELINGIIPDGISWDDYGNDTANRLSGTPATAGTGWFKLKAIDSQGQTFVSNINWDITAVFEDNIVEIIRLITAPAVYTTVSNSQTLTLSQLATHNVILASLPGRVLPNPQTYYALAVNMPASPIDGQKASISILNHPVDLTINDTTNPVYSSDNVQGQLSFIYRESTDTWYLI